jgi:choline-sulfatase
MLLCTLVSACARETRDSRFPGAPVVLISIDTLRSDHLPAYGYKGVETPHLDRLRRDAILFKSAWSPCPMTLPTHVTMLTGKNPPGHGVRNNLGFTFRSARHASLPTLLRGRGYATGAAVSSYVLRKETGLADAFESYEDVPAPQPGARFVEYQRGGERTAALAKAWMAGRGAAPFFFFLHLYEPHVPYDPPEPFRRFASPYDGEIAAADAVVGDVLETLRRSGVYDRAIVVLTSDHGEGLGDHGEEQHSILLYREALQVPLLLKLPGSRRGGETIEAPVQLADVFPTVAALTDVGAPAGIEGRSLLGPLPPTRALYGETLYPRLQLGWSELRSVVDGRHHLIEGPQPELYDLARDPGERRDLAAAQPAVAERLRAELRLIPEGDRAPGEVPSEVREGLAALGYVGAAGPAGAGPLPNPRERVHLLTRIREGLRLADAFRFREAASVFQGLVSEQPSLIEAWMKLGDVHTRAGHAEDAARAYAEAVRRSPSPAADMLLALGHAELRAGRQEKAEAAAHAAATDSPSGSLELLARIALFAGKIDEAAGRAAALAERERTPSSLVLVAEVRARRGDHLGALQAIEEAAARAAEGHQDRVFKLEYVRADALARLSRVAEAEAAYEREIAAFPDHLQAYANLSVLHFVQGRREKVGVTLERMVAAAPGPEAYRVAEKTLSAFGDRRAAEAWRRRATRSEGGATGPPRTGN